MLNIRKRRFRITKHALQRLSERYGLDSIGNKTDRGLYDYVKKLTNSRTLCKIKDKEIYFILTKPNYRAVTFITPYHAERLINGEVYDTADESETTTAPNEPTVPIEQTNVKGDS